VQYDRPPRGVRAVAVLETSKGLLALTAGTGLLAFAHGGTLLAVRHLIEWLHLDPAQDYARTILAAAASVTDSNLLLLFSGGIAYAAMRFIEGYGLWFGRRWAEWFAALSGAIYIPFELYKVFEGIDWVRVTVLAVNVLIVAYMCVVLYRSRSAQPVPLTVA
jgi:uncharacterized membrane protein (DUF2068 family)